MSVERSRGATCRRRCDRAVHADQRQRAAGEDHDLRGHDHHGRGSRPPRPGGQRHPAVGIAGGLLRGHPCLGSTIGRYANRIAKGRFRLDGVECRLATNNGPNHLHGGLRGIRQGCVAGRAGRAAGGAGVAFSYHSADGEEGYPARSLPARPTH